MNPSRVVESVVKMETRPDGIASLRKTAANLDAVADIAEMSEMQKSYEEVDWFLTLAAKTVDSAGMSAIVRDAVRHHKKRVEAGSDRVHDNLHEGTLELLRLCGKVCPEMRPNV